MITLETKQGKLVIESDVANVNIKLLREGEFYDELKVSRGDAATTLFADKYEVVIDGLSDAIVAEGDVIHIKRGETTVARIRQTKEQPPKVEGSEKLYLSKPLAYWLDVVERDRSHVALREAIVACHALAHEETSAAITAQLLKTMPELDSRLIDTRESQLMGSSSQSGGNGNTRGSGSAGVISTRVSLAPTGPTLDASAFELLRLCNPKDSYFQVLIEQLVNGSEAWKNRVLTTGVENLGIDEGVLTLTNWLDQNVLASNTVYKDLANPAANLYVRIINRASVDENAKTKLVSTLSNCDELSTEFWLTVAERSSRSFARQMPWQSSHRLILQEVEQRAIRALSSENVAIQCASIDILSEFFNPNFDRSRLPDSRKEVLKAIEHAFQAMLEDPSRLVQIHLPKATSYGGQSEFNGIRVSYTGAWVIPCKELIGLAKSMNGTGDLAPLLLKIYKATKPKTDQLKTILERNPVKSFTWPRFSTDPPVGSTPEQWISWFISDAALNALPERTREELKAISARSTLGVP